MANEAKPCPCHIGDTFEHQEHGYEVPIEHIKAYITKPSFSSDKAVIVIHDIFGWKLPNTRFIVDMLAEKGYIAICPDFFKGQEPWTPSSDWSTFEDWLKTRDAKKIKKETEVVLKYLKKNCNAKIIGVIGFCWGGAAVQHLMVTNPEFKAGVSICGVIRFFEDSCTLLNPTFFIFAEKDEVIPLEQVYALEKKVEKESKADFEFKIYPGQTHGFVHRKREETNPQDQPYIQEARNDMLNWLHRYMCL